MVEKINYNLVKTIHNIEIRNYPEIIIAKITIGEEGQAFNHLFNYISGNNKTQKKIPMTAPVISSEQIAMTAPVISNPEYMAFILPTSYSPQTVPLPLDPKITIEVIPKRLLAVYRFSGRASSKQVSTHAKYLIDMLQKQGIQTKDSVFLMRYNSPFAPGFIRRNEVAIEVTNFLG